jgi:hypothetical protein
MLNFIIPYLSQLSKIKKDQTTNIIVIRDGEEMTLSITL